MKQHRRLTHVTLFALLGVMVTLCSGCAYFRDRGNDALDSLRISFGAGYGLGVHAKFTGLFHPSLGTRGEFRRGGWDDRIVGFWEWDEREHHWPYTLIGVLGKNVEYPLKYHMPLVYARRGMWQGGDIKNRYRIESFSTLIWSEPPGIRAYTQYPYWRPFATVGDFEVGIAAAVLSFRIGLNLPEMLDMLVGITMLDIAGDDAAAQKRRLIKSGEAPVKKTMAVQPVTEPTPEPETKNPTKKPTKKPTGKPIKK
jgi:hypothetical protein